MFRPLRTFFLGFSCLFLSAAPPPTSIYDIQVEDIAGNPVSMSAYKGKVLLIVNVASRCGLTPQYVDLQAIYESYKEDGLVVLGFPANNFMNQEPGSEETIKQFCTTKYGVTFPMFSKISVKGKNQHPLYQYLTKKAYNGKEDSPVTWNFQKFLVGRDGQLLRVFKPKERVKDRVIKTAIRQHVKG